MQSQFIRPFSFRQYMFTCVLCAFVLGLALSPVVCLAQSSRPETWAQPISLEHTENFFQVTPFLYRSAQPSADALVAMEKMGIKSVLNLRYNHSDTSEAKNTTLVLQRIPMNTWNIKQAQIVEALAIIQTSPQPILVHCMHGADRTGLVIAMYRMTEQGWSKEAALDELKNGGYGYHSMWKNIPEFIEKVDVANIKRLVDEKVQQDKVVSF